MMLQKTFLTAGIAAALLGSSAVAQAAGFQLKEQSSSLQGAAFAGASAKADDLSTMFFNPAGLTRLDNATQASIVASYILPSAQFTQSGAATGPGGAPLTGNDGGDAGVGAVVPSFYGMMDLGLGDNWRTGMAVNTPFGLSTSYKTGWVGRFYALDSEVMTINVAPSVAYKINDTFSIGGNVQMQYVDARLTNNAGNSTTFAKLTGDDVAFGWGLGALWQPTDDTRVGVNYRSRIAHKLDGDIAFSGTLAGLLPALTSAKASANLTTPDILSAGIVHDINDKWSLMGEAAWTNWSLFDRLTVVDAAGTVRQDVDEGWNDTWFFSVGSEYKYSLAWTFRSGVAYDQSATNTAHRTLRIPETNRVWGSLGASYAFSPATSIDMNYTYIHAMDSRVNETAQPVTTGTVSGAFDSNVNIATVGVNFKF